MTDAIFFRLLKEPIEGKGEALLDAVAALNDGRAAGETFTTDSTEFGKIPGAPLAYWASSSIFRVFKTFARLEGSSAHVSSTNPLGEDSRYFRLFWETLSHTGASDRTWAPLAKGGQYSPYFHDLQLVADWDVKEQTYRGFEGTSHRPLKRPASLDYFFRPGLTWPRRTNGFSVRVLPQGCIFADKGPAIFVPDDDGDRLLALASVMNSALFGSLVRLQLARTELAQSYEVGLIQNTPVPALDEASQEQLSAFALRAHDLQREGYTADETTHVFGLPGLARRRDRSLADTAAALAAEAAGRAAALAALQAEIDDIVFDLYGLEAADREAVRRETAGGRAQTAEDPSSPTRPQTTDGGHPADSDDDDEDEPAATADLPAAVADLLMWCVGVAFGRWDVRFALDPSRLPPLPGPFDPLPRYAPGAWVDDATTGDGRPVVFDATTDHWPLATDHSPLTTQRSSASAHSPLATSPDGILVDDPGQPADLVGRVREVLDLLYGERSEAIEREACAALGVRDLRDYFRDPKRFFAFHIKRYSKSRRKAPIYWLLQSARRNYAVWLYYPRIGPSTYLQAARDHVDARVRREELALEGLEAGREGQSGAARNRLETAIERRRALLDELNAFRKTLDRVGSAKLAPDPNDGVLISIAPLHELVPWKEAAAMVKALKGGQYAWSDMSRRLK